jgi:hypothetical protein
MSQQVLFADLAPTQAESFARVNSHRDEPTSYAAAKAHAESGQAETNEAKVMNLVETWCWAKPRTSAELAAWGGMDKHEVRRRLYGLKRQGKVKECEQRKCEKAGTMAKTWQATEVHDE